MGQKNTSCGSVYDRVPLLSAKYPWFVAQPLEDDDQIFFTMHDPLSNYRCRIPELHGRCIRASFHGWVILSNFPIDIEWSFWNPITSKLIHLPPLCRKGDCDDIRDCLLSSPPEDPGSILLLTRFKKPNFVFCRLDRERKRLRWTEMSYAEQLRSVTGGDGFLCCLTCWNGNVYALCRDNVVQIDIVVNDSEVVITLLPFVKIPLSSSEILWLSLTCFLKATCTDLFLILVGSKYSSQTTIEAVYLFKLDTIGMVWKEIHDLEDAMFFVDLAPGSPSVFSSPAKASELGAYVYIRSQTEEIIYSYHVRDQTMSLSRVPGFMPTSYVLLSMWELHECKLEGDDHTADSKQEGNKDKEIVSLNGRTHLLDMPFNVLETIMELCVGVEYLQFRATSKHCRLAAPPIQWRGRLQMYSLVSPWLMAIDTGRGVIMFTDPLLGDKYFMKKLPVPVYQNTIHCSRYGWLFFFTDFYNPVFYNPFTSDLRKLPLACYFQSASFSAPPTSPNCMVVGFTKLVEWRVYILFGALDTFWHAFVVNCNDPHSFRFPIFYGRDVYALRNEGGLDVFREMGEDEGEGEGDFSWDVVVDDQDPRSCCTTFLVKCEQHLLQVVVGQLGEYVEVFKLNDSKEEWEKIDGLGRHTIYICGTSCLCIQAKIPEMENKIYFPRLHSGNGKIVFYSLETHRYHTFKDKHIEQNFGDFIGTKHVPFTYAWIEPSWS